MHTFTKLLLWGTTALVSLQLNGCCNLLDRGDGDENAPSDGPNPVTGELPPPRNGFLADLKFRPNAQGFNFENGGNAAYPRTPGFVNAPEMIRLFGAKDVCIGGRVVGNNCRMTPAAAESGPNPVVANSMHITPTDTPPARSFCFTWLSFIDPPAGQGDGAAGA